MIKREQPVSTETQGEFPFTRLSYSALSAFKLCGRNFFYSRIAKIPAQKSIDALWGVAIHNVIEEYLKDRENFQTVDALHRAWSSQFYKLKGAWSKEPGLNWRGKDEAQLLAMGRAVFSSPQIMQSLNEITVMELDGKPAIEKYFSFDLEGVPVPIVGYIDLITAKGIPLDLKTAGKKWNQGDVTSALQPLVYLQAMETMGIPSPGNRFCHVVITRTTNPQIQAFISTRDVSEFEWIAEEFRTMVATIQAGIFPEAEAGHWICTPKWCEYWSICKGAYPDPKVTQL